MADELALDLEELRQLQKLAKRPRVLSLISSEIYNWEKLLKEPVSVPVPIPTPTPIATGVNVPSTSALNYVTLGSFSWDQDDDKVKIYVSLEGVEQEKIETDFKPMSFDVKFHNVQGKNYRCAIPKLNNKIVPEQCKVLVKPTRVIITLFKASKGNWLDLHFKEDKLKPNLDKEQDPMAGIMDIMKNMYEEGDDETKRNIAKAWSDARSGKAADPRSVAKALSKE
ncbi:hypothetical protein P3X46_026648 [Hevea brasiliensis]|uniref:Calcyclin-binding protein n=1 Tax=Hevea brasiliensis TaxID=3981 RepID=A0ABQ9KYA4_HEVBR|nr:uncharacterized protein LOC110661809 [Hevea brasiliensis]KAJ9153181.1 hypothetical protein P3X46_026648 [Hevea brasiliensis]